MYTLHSELVEGHSLKINVLRQAQDERIILYFGLANKHKFCSVDVVL